MVHGNSDGGSNKTASSPVRSSTRIRSARFQPTARTIQITKSSPQRNLNQTCSTIYRIDIPTQNTIGTSEPRPCQSHILHSLKNFGYRDGARHNMTTLRTQRNEKSVLDKVEDMDVDNQSDQEITYLGAEETGTSSSSGSSTSGLVRGKSVKTKKGNKHQTAREKEIKKNSVNEQSLSGSKVKKKSQESIARKKPIYIILHASQLRVGHLEGRALRPVRIQAGRILIEMELQTSEKEMPAENLTLRIPCKELLGIKVNLSEPPFLFVAVINQSYSKTLVDSSKNGLLNKLKGTEKLQIIVHLMYDVKRNDARQDFDNFRSELDVDVGWEEISSVKAERILSGQDGCAEEAISTTDVKDDEDKVEGNRKRQTENKDNDIAEGGEVKRRKKDTSPSISETREDSRESSSAVGIHRNKPSCDGAIPKSPEPEETQREERTAVSEEKSVSKSENNETSPQNHHPQVVSADGANALKERSFEGQRLDARRVFELESNIAEQECFLTQQRRTVELRDLQLQQERDTVRALRSSLREEQRTKRDLEARYEEINGEMLVRNTCEAIASSRVQDLERELSELNLSLSSSGTENHRLVQEIHQVRGRMTENEEALRNERERVMTLQVEIETSRTTLDSLREEFSEKERELLQERERSTERSGRNSELERRLIEYEGRLTRSNEEHTRTRREHEECNSLLISTRERLQDANRALHRAQETVDEYSRMQPRDWTISRDEITITEKMLGRGAWGWVKEGKFRGTAVAIKQMHELIVSPHNRRLFEREMQIAARCRHPNLLQFIGATSDNGLALLVTELLDTDLRSVLGQRSLCHDEVVTLATDVSRALNYLHLNKPFPIIHRDISSTNVLLWKREDVYHAKLSDYGAANFMRQCMTVSPGACIYAAPEAVTSRQSTKVDVYSFGLLLCEMCIRELPVPGHTRDQIRSITNGHLRELVQRSTNETPDDRPTITEVLTALLRLSSNTTLGTVSLNNRHILV